MDLTIGSTEYTFTFRTNTVVFLFLYHWFRGSSWGLDEVLGYLQSAVYAVTCPGNGIPMSLEEFCRIRAIYSFPLRAWAPVAG